MPEVRPVPESEARWYPAFLMGLAYEEGVREILRDAGLGEGSEIRPLSGGLSNTVYAVDRRFVVRIGTGVDGDKLPVAADVLRAVEGRVAAPSLVCVDFSRERVPANVLVCSFVEGRLGDEVWAGASGAEREGLVRAVAGELDALHAVRAEAIPCLWALPPWPERVERRARVALARARASESFERLRLDRMEAYLERHVAALDDASPAVPVHYDVRWENALFRNGVLAALLDFDDVELAPAEADVWELLFAVGADDHEAAALYGIQDLYGELLRAPGVLERFAIGEIEEILKLASDELGWISRSAARREADRAYERTFQSDTYARLLARVVS